MNFFLLLESNHHLILLNIPFSNNMFTCRIHDIAEGINEQIIEKLSDLFIILLEKLSVVAITLN